MKSVPFDAAIPAQDTKGPVAAVFAKHESRKLFVELEALTHERDELNIEWGQLQIEQSTWSTHARIEQVATEDLSLVRPAATEIYVIERP